MHQYQQLALTGSLHLNIHRGKAAFYNIGFAPVFQYQ
jgi:hypothetical protein